MKIKVFADVIKETTFTPTWVRRPEVLLCANTVKPMHGVVPRVILGEEWWDKERRAAYTSTEWHCIACGVYKLQAKEHKWLEGHELYRIDYKRGRQTYIETVPLCHYCHNFIHDGRLKALVMKEEVAKEKYNAVIFHGLDILKEAGLRKTRPKARKLAKWEDWRLILFGKEYPPLYKNYQEWCQAFGGLSDD